MDNESQALERSAMTHPQLPVSKTKQALPYTKAARRGHRSSRWWLAQAVLFMCSLPSGIAQSAPNAAQLGKWQILANTISINPVHASVMSNGKVFMINAGDDRSGRGAEWDPATQSATTFSLSYSMFCNGMVVLPDGRPFVIGGTLHLHPFTGYNRATAYDPKTGTFTEQVSMARGRWYPTGTVLSDGTVLAFSGTDENGDTNDTIEIFTPDSGTGSWSSPVAAGWEPPLYPRMHLLPDGRVFYSGADSTARFYDLSTQSWTDCCTTNLGTDRYQGSSVLLPLTPGNSYRPKVMIFGGAGQDLSTPATKTTESVDLSVAAPQWSYGPDMSQPRMHMNATLLPTGNVLVTGGEEFSEDGTTASLNADLYHSNPSDPNYNKFTSAGANSIARMYHSNAILLPDATVILTGSNPPNVGFENRIELYQPAYLFNSDGTLATRPAISGVPAGKVGYNTTFRVQTPNAASIASVVLLRPGSVTHAFDMDQRLVGLSFTKNARTGVLTVTSPPNTRIAPPGFYMLFILNATGVPSEARFVQFCPASGCL